MLEECAELIGFRVGAYRGVIKVVIGVFHLECCFAMRDERAEIGAPALVGAIFDGRPVESAHEACQHFIAVFESDGHAAFMRFGREPEIIGSLVGLGNRESRIVFIAVNVVWIDCVTTFGIWPDRCVFA